MGQKINEYAVTASTVEAGSWFDIDQEISPGVYQSQKLSIAVLRVAIGNIYVSDGTLTEARTVNLNNHSLEFVNGQVAIGIATTLQPLAGATTQIVDFNTGNNQVLDLETADNDIALTLQNAKPGGFYTIKIIQGANVVNVTYPASVKWEAGQVLIPTTIDDAIDLVTLYFDGTNFLASFGTNYQ